MVRASIVGGMRADGYGASARSGATGRLRSTPSTRIRRYHGANRVGPTAAPGSAVLPHDDPHPTRATPTADRAPGDGREDVVAQGGADVAVQHLVGAAGETAARAPQPGRLMEGQPGNGDTAGRRDRAWRGTPPRRPGRRHRQIGAARRARLAAAAAPTRRVPSPHRTTQWRCGLAVSPPRWMAMLQVQSLSVEVGGRQIIDGASFTVMPRDKVGLVGRNGAGKTTLFRVLGGALEPTGGKILRKGGFGYLPQDPRIAGVLDGRTAITHVLSGRGIDEELIRLEKLRLTMEEDASERNVGRYSRAQDEFATVRRIRRRERGPIDGCRSGAAGRPAGAADRRAQRWRAASCRTGPHPLRRLRRAAARRAHQPPRHRRQDVACCSSCAPTAARCW